MTKNIRIALLAVALASSLSAQTATFQPHAYKTSAGATVDAELGEFQVPENRTKAGSRQITLRFVRFKSTAANPGPPIVYLAGGPGGSGIESVRGTRYALVTAMREFGDVIAYDQRGTNRSGPDVSCKEEFAMPPGEPLDRQKGGALMNVAARKCAERLRASGVDVGAYNTRESAADLNDLRKALGAQKLVLWGISYGAHLGLATLRYHPDAIDRVILAGIEGPDDTYKLPSDQQTLVEDIARLAARDGKHPDMVGAIAKLLRELEARPKSITLTHPKTEQTATFVFGKLDLQRVLADMLFGPDSFAGMPDFVARLEQGDWMALALAAAPGRFGNAGSAMSIAMDCAAGISASRRALIAQEAKRTLLGDAINAPFPEVCAGLGVADAGDEYRAPLRSNVRALLISGTLDGRTRPRQADEVRLTLPNAEHLVIDGAGHSDPLFLSTPKILEAMKAFMRGEPLRERYVEAKPFQFTAPRKVVTVAEDKLAGYAGTYKIDERMSLVVVKRGSLLYVTQGNRGPYAMRPLSDTEFFFENLGATAKFEGNTLTVAIQNGPTFRGTR
jgi:pimeloyl-ACP methyl ester carboxylesterase